MTRIFTPLPLLLLAACNNEPGVVIAEPDDGDFLTVMERFEAAYVGQWQENGNCTGGDDVLVLSDDAFSYGDTSCAIGSLSRNTAKVRVKLEQCEVAGEPMGDRTYVLDLAGSDVMYIDSVANGRERLERCES